MKKIIAIAVSLAIVFTVFTGCSKETVYRLIKVKSFVGEVTVEREEKMEVFEGLQLISEDSVEVGRTSFLELLADSDKHIIAEGNTAFKLHSTGTETSGNITIDLLYGKSLFTIDNKLPDGSEFIVNTPNTTLSVRGTSYSVEYSADTEESRVTVFEGQVHAKWEGGESLIGKGGEIAVTGSGDNIAVEFISEGDVQTLPETDQPATENTTSSAPVSGSLIGDEDWSELLKGGADYDELTYLLEIASRCEYQNKNDYLNDALYLMCCETYKKLPYTVIDTLEDGSTVYSVSELNRLFSFLTDDTIDKENLNPGINRLDGDRLICTSDLLADRKTTSTGIYSSCYGEAGEIIIDYQFNVVDNESLDVERFTKKAYLVPDETGKYVLSHLE